MAITVVTEMPSNAGSAVGGNTGAKPTSPRTFGFTNGLVGSTATEIVVLGFVVAGPGSRTVTLGTISYGGITMTAEVVQTTSGGATGGKAALYYLQSPPTGANNFSIAWTDDSLSAENLNVVAGAIALSGVASGDPTTQSASAQGSGLTASVGLSGVAKLTLGAMFHGTSLGGTFNHTNSWLANFSDLTSAGNGRMTRATATGSVTHSATATGSDSWIALALELAEATAGPVKTGAGIVGP